jgi:primase-polymerase (primpol)-like protein
MASGVGDGIGLMMGDGLACFDLDHCLVDGAASPEAREVIAAITEPILYVERSMSGDGLHIFVESHATRGYRRGGVEFYPTGRFIALTGDTFLL